jgi:hypothetical protein
MGGTARGCRPSRQVVRGGYREGRRLRGARARPETWPALPGLRRKYGGAECWEAAEQVGCAGGDVRRSGKPVRGDVRLTPSAGEPRMGYGYVRDRECRSTHGSRRAGAARKIATRFITGCTSHSSPGSNRPGPGRHHLASPTSGVAASMTGRDGCRGPHFRSPLGARPTIYRRSLDDLDFFWMSGTNPGNLRRDAPARVGGGGLGSGRSAKPWCCASACLVR